MLDLFLTNHYHLVSTDFHSPKLSSCLHLFKSWPSPPVLFQSATATTTRTRVTLTWPCTWHQGTSAVGSAKSVFTTPLDTTASSASRFTTSTQRGTSETPISATVSPGSFHYLRKCVSGAQQKLTMIFSATRSTGWKSDSTEVMF